MLLITAAADGRRVMTYPAVDPEVWRSIPDAAIAAILTAMSTRT